LLSFESAVEAPVVQDESQQESNAPVSADGTSTDSAAERDAFDINSVPEEYREHVVALERQFKGEFTRKSQELAEQRKQFEAHEAELDFVKALNENPETQQDVFKQLAEILNYDLNEEDVDGGEAEVTEPVNEDPRLTELLSQLEADAQLQQQRDHLDATAGQIAKGVEAAEKEFGRELSQHEQTLFLQSAMSRTAEDGSPDVEGAKQFMRALEADFQTRWIDSKKSAQVHAGVQGSQTLDLSDDATRRQHMLDQIEAHGSLN
jgi:hypothetical protein